MDPSIDHVLSLFGITLQQFTLVATVTYMTIQFLKNKLGDAIMYGIRTDLVAIVLAFGLSLHALGMPVAATDWVRVAVLALLGYVGPAGLHSALKEQANRKKE